MQINSFKDNCIWVLPKIIKNSAILLLDCLEEVYITDTSEKYIVIVYNIDNNFKNLILNIKKEQNAFVYWTENNKLYVQFIIPESKKMRSEIIQKCGYKGLLKSEIIDFVLFYKKDSIEVLRYYEKTLTARDEQSGFIFFNQVSLFDFRNIYVLILNQIFVHISYVVVIT